MQSEIDSVMKHKTWLKIKRSSVTKGTMIISNKWIFTVKQDEKGFVKHFKARLVIHGNGQQQGIIYNETFAPMIRFETIRAAIYYTKQRG